MDLNDKIAARRREVERERLRVAAEEAARKKLEEEQRLEALRLAREQEVIAAAANVQESLAQRGYVSAEMGKGVSDIDKEKAVFVEAIELITRVELGFLLAGTVLCVMCLLTQELGAAMLFAILTLTYLFLVYAQHRYTIVSAQSKQPGKKPI